MKREKPPRWSAARFARLMDRRGLTSEALSRLLARRGFLYGASGVRRWRKPGSTGPKHPGAAKAVWKILEVVDG
ncbi:MAG: hypothetical protein CMH55_07570 [Myxococcales bacterium]|nr:hypothetical protein [Myxococcales bacterium]|tara:strand:- start:681 stop:902 length:222 start_codon:yes stop_codon:yes gene_type:complete